MSSVVSVGFVMGGQLASLWWDGVVSERGSCRVCCCMLCVSWAEHWRLEGKFVLMVLVCFEWHVLGVLMGIWLLLCVAGEGDVCGFEQVSRSQVWELK